MHRSVSWLVAAGVATALSAASFAAALGAQHRANAACAADGALPWCGLGLSVLHTIALFAGLGFLLLAALFLLSANNARVTARAARQG